MLEPTLTRWDDDVIDMNAKKWSKVTLLVSAGIAAVFGGWYLFASDIPPYYERALGPELSAEPRVHGMLLDLMKVMGGCFLALGGGLSYLALTLVDRDPGKVFWMVVINLGPSLVPLQYATLSIGSRIEYRTPWWAITVLLVLMASTLVLLHRARRSR